MECIARIIFRQPRVRLTFFRHLNQTVLTQRHTDYLTVQFQTVKVGQGCKYLHNFIISLAITVDLSHFIKKI